MREIFFKSVLGISLKRHNTSVFIKLNFFSDKAKKLVLHASKATKG